jgi:cytosine/adenosine deaminase-related metal-dependent hydrolase
LWDELRFTLEIFPDDLAEQELLTMVTIGGAAALGISATCGSLEVGKRADFQVVGNFGSNERLILERIIRDGRVHEVFVGGERYRGNTTA